MLTTTGFLRRDPARRRCAATVGCSRVSQSVSLELETRANQNQGWASHVAVGATAGLGEMLFARLKYCVTPRFVDAGGIDLTTYIQAHLVQRALAHVEFFYYFFFILGHAKRWNGCFHSLRNYWHRNALYTLFEAQAKILIYWLCVFIHWDCCWRSAFRHKAWLLGGVEEMFSLNFRLWQHITVSLQLKLTFSFFPTVGPLCVNPWWSMLLLAVIFSVSLLNGGFQFVLPNKSGPRLLNKHVYVHVSSRPCLYAPTSNGWLFVINVFFNLM